MCVVNRGEEVKLAALSLARDLRAAVSRKTSSIWRISAAIDPALISSELGWRPRHDVQQGLAETVRWYLSHQEWCSKVRERAGYDGRRLGIGAAQSITD